MQVGDKVYSKDRELVETILAIADEGVYLGRYEWAGLVKYGENPSVKFINNNELKSRYLTPQMFAD